MRYLELCTLTGSQIDDLLGLMKELNAELNVTPLQQQRSVASPGTRIFIAENDEKHIVGCATLCVFESPTGRKASVEDVVVLPAYRGQGIGRTLLQRIIDFAKNKLAPIDLRLTSNPTRTEANAMYQALGFEKRDTNVYMMKCLFKDKTLLITGGTGSFGNAVLNRFLRTDIGEIRIFSRDEKKQDDMRHDFQARMPEVANKIKFYIGDVRNKSTLKYAMKGVDYVFHAAALKQVPSCEFFPMEAVKTNVIGTDNVLDAAIDAGVKCVICLSTDKAAYPINAMGITKAIEEKIAVAKSRLSG